jgi:hypothetical protein
MNFCGYLKIEQLENLENTSSYGAFNIRILGSVPRQEADVEAI